VTHRHLWGALEARGIPAGDGLLASEATGEVELDGRVLVIRRIHVTYHLSWIRQSARSPNTSRAPRRFLSRGAHTGRLYCHLHALEMEDV